MPTVLNAGKATSAASSAKAVKAAALARGAKAATAGRAQTLAAPALPSLGTGLTEGDLQRVVGYRLAQAAVLADAVFMQEVGAGQDLRPVEYTVLQLVACNPGSSPVHLARALSLTKASISMWVDKLEARGLVRREPSPTDGRAQQLRATAAGRKLADAAIARLLAGERRSLAHLSDAEVGMLVELLHKMVR